MPDRFCPHCGFSVADSERFCLQCGSEVRGIPEDQDQSSPNDRTKTESTGGGPDEDEAASEPPRRSADQSKSSDERVDTEDDSHAPTAAAAAYDAEVKPGEPPPDHLRPRTDEHKWQGKLFVGLSWVSFAILVVIAPIVFLATLVGEFEAGTVAGFLLAGLLGGVSAFIYWFTRAVRDFDRRGWYALWVVLFLNGSSYVFDLATASGMRAATEVSALILTLVWCVYFWGIRHRYGIGSERGDWRD